ncbi:MAG: hypothetical protein JWN44_458 [Myxococcales bacterium]|nr:hypothetical protein [Myxococcales bacterium]
MACEFFDEGKLARCTAVCGLLIPSHHERENYCRTDGHVTCPTFKLYQLNQAPVPQEQYYALWVPPAPRPSARADAEQPLSVAV